MLAFIIKVSKSKDGACLKKLRESKVMYEMVATASKNNSQTPFITEAKPFSLEKKFKK
jgi:hypothetical protein